MLFDTLLKKNRAEAEEQAWTKNAPAEYESRNKADMDALTGQVGSGFDWDTASKAYQQYRDRVTGEAQDAAANAQANAAMLAGGYGSSYADSVAKQGQQQALAGIDNAVPQLRSQALTEYQNRQNGLLEALSGMANTEALDQSAYGSNLANYNNRLNFLQNQSAQARSENDNYWNNLWNGITQAGGVLLDAYDGYKGYSYQKAQLEMQKQQQNQQSAELALKMYPYAPELALAIAQDAGYDSSLFDNYSVDGPVTRAEKANAYVQGTGLLSSGFVEAAKNYANLYGIDPSGLGDYDTVNDRILQQVLTEYMSKKSTGGSGGGTNKESIEPVVKLTGSQLLSYKKERDAVAQKGGDTSWYDAILAANGVPVESESKSTTPGRNSKLALDMSSKWGGQNAAGKSGTYGGTVSGMPYSNALSYAQGWKKQGLDANTIASRLMNMGATDDIIDRAMQGAGF